MATAQVQKRIIPAVEEITGVTLTLTKAEAETLHDVCRHISGKPDSSRRGLMDCISNALKDAGFYRAWSDFKNDIRTGLAFEEKV